MANSRAWHECQRSLNNISQSLNESAKINDTNYDFEMFLCSKCCSLHERKIPLIFFCLFRELHLNEINYLFLASQCHVSSKINNLYDVFKRILHTCVHDFCFQSGIVPYVPSSMLRCAIPVEWKLLQARCGAFYW